MGFRIIFGEACRTRALSHSSRRAKKGCGVASMATIFNTRLDPAAFAPPFRRAAINASLQRRINESEFLRLLALTELPAGALGIDLSRLCASQRMNSDVRALVRAAAADDAAALMFDLDYSNSDVRRGEECDDGACPAPAATIAVDHPSHRHLRQHGWVSVRDWGLDVEALNAQSRALLMPRLRHERGVIVIRQPTIPALIPLLSNASLARLLEAHLGGPVRVRYDGLFSDAF